jgi:hypothetical protein
MPDEQGKLTEAEKDQAIKLITTKGSRAPVCSICGTNGWQLADHLVQPISQGTGGLFFGGTAYPQVMLICRKCSHTVFFNAVALGLIPATTKGA